MEVAVVLTTKLESFNVKSVLPPSTRVLEKQNHYKIKAENIQRSKILWTFRVFKYLSATRITSSSVMKKQRILRKVCMHVYLTID